MLHSGISANSVNIIWIHDSTARRLNITNQKVTQLAAKGAGAGGGKAKK